MKISRSLLAAVATSVSLVIATAAGAQPADKPAEKPKDAQPATTPPATKPAEPAKPEAKPADPTTPAAAPAGTEEKLVYVKIATSKGDIIAELNNEKAPISVKNFLSYVDKKHYDGTIFHRVIETFMIQGGGHNADLSEKPTGEGIKNEWKNGLKNVRGALAMARKPIPDSATAQFFINTVDNPFLDKPQPDGAAYAVFGKVIGGMDVVDKIKVVKTATKSAPNGQPFQNVPVETITITSITKMSPEDAKKAAGVK